MRKQSPNFEDTQLFSPTAQIRVKKSEEMDGGGYRERAPLVRGGATVAQRQNREKHPSASRSNFGARPAPMMLQHPLCIVRLSPWLNSLTNRLDLLLLISDLSEPPNPSEQRANYRKNDHNEFVPCDIKSHQSDAHHRRLNTNVHSYISAQRCTRPHIKWLHTWGLDDLGYVSRRNA